MAVRRRESMCGDGLAALAWPSEEGRAQVSEQPRDKLRPT